MKNFFTLLFLLSVPVSAHAAILSRGPYVEAVTQESAVIRWKNASPEMNWLEYGAEPNCDYIQTIAAENMNQEISVYGLRPGTQYCYRILSVATDTTTVEEAASGSFMTLRPETDNALEFLAFGDSGSGTEQQYELAQVMNQFNPDFVLHTGDMLSNGLNSRADTEYFAPYKDLLAKAPFFLALGNHDYGDESKKEQGKNFLKKNYLPYHRMPWSEGTPHYYSFRSANATFIFLDVNKAAGEAIWAPPLTEKSAQYRWLEKTLEKASSTWKFVILHEPVFSTGGHGSTEALVDLLAPLFERYRVDMVLQGHDHDYERTRPIKNEEPVNKGGVIYVTLGGGGSQLYIQTYQEDWMYKFAAVYHFAHFKINRRTLTLNVYNIKNSLVDTLTLTK